MYRERGLDYAEMSLRVDKWTREQGNKETRERVDEETRGLVYKFTSERENKEITSCAQ